MSEADVVRRRSHRPRRLVVWLLVLAAVAPGGADARSAALVDATRGVGENRAAATVIAKYRARIPELMA